ncbi:MAG: single-stranded DNA-binding protein [Candidatus Zixiibacteriota bacterium]|nr:MAG: single-stranded DNA-binding protein [candidate division Zixibacteria bacterium]
MSVNKAILIGNLGKDPELRYTPSGKAVVQFSLATTDRWTDQNGERKESTTWHNIVAWGRQAEVMNEYLRKGKQVYIEGRIDNRSYEDKEGNKRYVSEIVVQNFQFIGSRGNGGNGGNEPQPNAAPQAKADSSGDDDLPF